MSNAATISDNACTFAVDDVSMDNQALQQTSYPEAIARLIGAPIESCSSYRGMLLEAPRYMHPLVGALHWAYFRHRPVVLSPDAIWITITQGLALHITAHAKQLRQQFVAQEGQVTIRVRRDDFIKGSPENPWPEVFAAFSDGVRRHIGDENHRLIVADFSTTGPVERAASEIVLLDAMQKYFHYEMLSLCGIPQITLTGTVADWERLAARVEGFRRFGLDWWIDALSPVLQQVAAARRGDVDLLFWKSIYKYWMRGSTNPHVSGWIINLFPYLLGNADWKAKTSSPLERNRFLGSEPPPAAEGPEPDEFPRQPARAPFVWTVGSHEFNMEFIGGLIGVREDPQTLALSPEVGWAVRDVDSPVEQMPC